jgi:gliding motility-associated-like protein
MRFLLTYFLPFFLLYVNLFGQTTQSYQDCGGAIAVCSDFIQIAEPSQDYGWVVEADESCLGGERNSMWFRLRVGTAGNLCFNLQPAVDTDNYDWAIYDVTGRHCSNFKNRSDWLVTCNQALSEACQGTTGLMEGQACTEAFEPCLAVNPGEEFLLRIQSRQTPQGGFDLDFGPSTAELVPPTDRPYVQADRPCYGKSQPITVNPVEGGDVYWFHDRYDEEPFFIGNDYATIPVLEPHTYYVETVNGRGCPEGRHEILLVPYPEVNAYIEVTDSLVEYPSSVISFSLGGNIFGRDHYWQLGDGTTSTLATPVYAYPYPGRYLVTVGVRDENGCAYNLQRVVEVLPLRDIFIPTAFSPNEDGSNDLWTITTYLPRQFMVRVFNRFGKVVFESQNPAFAWGGRLQDGSMAPMGTYSYRVSYVDFTGNRQHRAGILTLIR